LPSICICPIPPLAEGTKEATERSLKKIQRKVNCYTLGRFQSLPNPFKEVTEPAKGVTLSGAKRGRGGKGEEMGAAAFSKWKIKQEYCYQK